MKRSNIPLILVVLAFIVAGFLLLPIFLKAGDRDIQNMRKLQANVSFWDNFVVLEWDPNPAGDHVTNYILYMGTQSHSYPAKLVLGNQTSVGILNNHPITYCALTAKNAVGESPKSAEVSFTHP